MELPTDDAAGRPETPQAGEGVHKPATGIEVAPSVTDCNPPVTARSSFVADDFLKAAHDADHPYFSLADVLLKAYEQAAMGKGRERHAQDRPFTDQPMQMLCALLGSADGPAYQAMKKIQESQRLDHDPAVRELLGAIIYLAGAVLYRESTRITPTLALADPPTDS